VRKNRSRTFAVLVTKGDVLDVYVLYRRIDIETDEVNLITKRVQGWSAKDADQLILTLNCAGTVCRFYDDEEKVWKQASEIGGVSVVRGSKDGSWGIPDVDEFESDYLAVG